MPLSLMLMAYHILCNTSWDVSLILIRSILADLPWKRGMIEVNLPSTPRVQHNYVYLWARAPAVCRCPR